MENIIIATVIKIDIYAEPNEGWDFDYWLIDGHTHKISNPYTLKLDHDYEARAIFKSKKLVTNDKIDNQEKDKKENSKKDPSFLQYGIK
jgi:hypothetical protein